MAAPKGNDFYKIALLNGNSGRTKIFESPEQFLEKAVSYFQWVKDHPMVKKDFIKSGQTAGQIVEIEVDRPMSIEGLCNHLGITFQTFLNYEKDESNKELFEAFRYVRQIIDIDHFEGGMIGNYNPAIVMSKLGLKNNVDHSGEVKQTVTAINFVQKVIEDIPHTVVQDAISNE